MNKITHSDDDLLEDYTEMLKDSDLSKAVRGKYANDSSENNTPIVTITGEDGVRTVTMTTLEVEVIVTATGQLIVETPSKLKPGKYRAALIIEEPVRSPLL